MIAEYDPQIYPCRLWVAVTTDLKSLSDKFNDVSTGVGIDTSFIYDHEAVTYYVQSKEKPKHYGILIASTAKHYFTTKLIAHEATHGAEFIWQHVGEKRRGSEADAYLVGWIAEKIEEVTRKTKKK